MTSLNWFFPRARERMQSEWNKKGAENAYGWVVTSRQDWQPDEYYATGKEHVDQYITPLFKGKDTTAMTALDIGCGTGRMTRHMNFGSVIGIDVSQTMIEKARADNPHQTYLVTDGVCFRPVTNESVDFAFSLRTLQHVTRKYYLEHTFREIFRVLKPGGTARINVRGFPAGIPGTVRWWKSFDTGTLVLTKIRGITVPYYRFFDPLRGVSVTPAQLRYMTRQFSNATVWSDGSPQGLWVDLVKSKVSTPDIPAYSDELASQLHLH